MTGSAPGIGGIAAICVDSADPVTLAAFWHALLGGESRVDDDGDASLDVDGLHVDFLRVGEPKTVKGRLHIDVRATDFDEAVATALALGARRADDVYDGDRWQVLRDPEGNEFCILRPPTGIG